MINFVHATGYLRFLNEPEEFARQHNIRDRALVRYLLARNEAIRIWIRERADVARRARDVLAQWKAATRADSLRGVADWYREKLGPKEPLADPRGLQADIQSLAGAGTRGASMRVLEDAFMLQELLILRGQDPVRDFARLRPLLRDWAKPEYAEIRPGTMRYIRTVPPLRLAKFFPDVSERQLKTLVRRADRIAFRLSSDSKRLTRLERRAMRLVAGIGPLQQLQQLHDRALVCRLCERVFIRQRGKPAQRYCPTCRRRWSKEQLWYKSGGKDDRKRWHAERRKEEHNEH